ncbi:MAG: methyl-accepting chemotaxis protein [Clostridiales bacterium]|nr:methyl-accepting chemotaxis protein [Clostridiales bacterium]
MKIKSLGLKISLMVTLIIVVMLAITYWIVSVQTNSLLNEITGAEAKAANKAFAKVLEEYQNEAHVRAMMIANEIDVEESVLAGNNAELKRVLNGAMEGLDVITLCDANGIVMARGHSDQTGDNVMDQGTLSVALKTGTGVSTIERGSLVGLSTRASAAIKDQAGRTIGAVVCGHDLADPKYVDEIKEQTECEITLFNGDTRMSTTLHNDDGSRAVGSQASDAVIQAVINGRQDYASNIELFGSNYSAHYSPLIRDNEVLGMLFVGVNIDESLAEQKSMLNLILLAAAVCSVAGICLMLVFSMFAVTRPLKKIGVLAEKIKTGDIGVTSNTHAATGIRSADEVGVLARSLEQAYLQLQGYVKEINDRMEGLSAGDLVTESTYDFHGDFVFIKNSMNSIVKSFNQMMSDVSISAQQVSTGAKQIADGAQTLAQGSTEQAATIQELSSDIGDMMNKINQNAHVAKEAADLSDTIRGRAETGSGQMDQMMQAVREINDASDQISKVIKVIDDIAFQTNILALNAAVEAARAGQHGKGFAVVAEEVRNLAAKSAEAAKDTGGLIENSIEKANLGLRVAGETASSLNEIVDGISRSAEIVAQIAASSDEQAIAITNVNTGIDQVSQVVQQNSATAEQSAASSEEMSGQSNMLIQLISHFKM